LHPAGRCPRCGYVLRHNGYSYRCDFCGYPHARRTLRSSAQKLERSLKNRIENLFEGTRPEHHQRPVTFYPVALRQLRPCIACGNNIPLGIHVCPICGASQLAAQPTAPAPKAGGEPARADQRVLDYIVAHSGTISLSQAGQELAMTPDALRFSIDRLKASGLLDQA
jgi:uncharacterized Zn finger protein (UPF0148 family)